MPICKGCKEEVDELIAINIDGKRRKLCEECAEVAEHDQQMAEESESAIQQMMGFSGRR